MLPCPLLNNTSVHHVLGAVLHSKGSIMRKEPNHPARWAALAAWGLILVACQGPEAMVTPSSIDSPTKLALSSEERSDLSRLEPLLRRPSQDLPMASDGNGGKTLDLQGGFQTAVIVQKNPDGTRSYVCTDSIDRAKEFFARDPRPSVEER